jgi:two-component system, LytTR family, response regulator
MLKAIIIDDEAHGIKTLEWAIAEYWNTDIEIIQTTQNPIEGLKLVNSLKPDVLFLDIEMPHLSGIDLANMIQHNATNIVFTTAYDQYAIKAIKLSALDYLLKPIDHEELGRVIQKIKENATTNASLQIQNLYQAQKTKIADKIALKNTQGFSLVSFDEIVFIRGENNYSEFTLADNSKTLISKTLGSVEEMLDMKLFFRIHKGYIINLKHIKSYVKSDGGDVIMSDGTTITISRNRKDEFLELFE